MGSTSHLLYNVNNDPVTKILRLLRPIRRNLHRFRERGFGKSSEVAQYLVLRLKEDNLLQQSVMLVPFSLTKKSSWMVQLTSASKTLTFTGTRLFTNEF